MKIVVDKFCKKALIVKERDLPKQRVVVVLMFNAERSTVFVLYLSQIFLEHVRTLS